MRFYRRRKTYSRKRQFHSRFWHDTVQSQFSHSTVQLDSKIIEESVRESLKRALPQKNLDKTTDEAAD